MRLVYLLSFFSSIFLINKTNGQNAGYFSVSNSGAYMARFFVSFNYNGNTVTYETGKNNSLYFSSLIIKYIHLNVLFKKVVIQLDRQKL